MKERIHEAVTQKTYFSNSIKKTDFKWPVVTICSIKTYKENANNSMETIMSKIQSEKQKYKYVCTI